MFLTLKVEQITIKMTDFNTSLLKQGRHYYDVIIDDGSTYGIEKVVEGMIMVEDTAATAGEAPIPPDKTRRNETRRLVQRFYRWYSIKLRPHL